MFFRRDGEFVSENVKYDFFKVIGTDKMYKLLRKSTKENYR